MLGIAIRYGVTLEALQAANPTADARMLSIGTQLVVPLMGTEEGPQPTETPVPLPIGAPTCYPAGDGGVWCAAYLINDQETELENLSAWMGLYVGDEVWASQTVVPPLNKVAAGEQAPLVAYFAGPVPAGAWPRVEALTSIPVAEEGSRYLQVETDEVQVELLADSRAAQVKAQVVWAEGQAVPGSVWVVAAAEDVQGRLVGMRKLETRPTCAQEANCRSMEVTLTVFSLGPDIETVRLFVEARP